ncbi:peptidase M13 [Novosphingobium marinum]|uniref:Putative endopeptidase n=1 Tax=Novosphingobium marinum TaxID=1514948 RepID=A0A7Y9XXF1_9SPHN|nr:M13 family metallopeptidase [Novosphingobium marinum]NYH96190.1 putative endopeptidase [Novosphingobium marinum]GGC33204.1 peptidase M13 [Novosphingobium marinum]
MQRLTFGRLAASAALPVLALSMTVSPALAQDEASAVAAPVGDLGDWGSFGVQTQWIDRSVDPGDDFNAYVNGEWNKVTEIPADKSRIGAFITLRDLSEERIHGILEELVASNPAPGTAEARIADAYNAFMDTDAIDAKGVSPVYPYLQKIYATQTTEDLMKIFATPGFASPVGAWVDGDAKQSDIYALYVTQGGLGLPDRDYYLKDSERYREIRAKYVDYLSFVLGKAGYQDSLTAARAVMSLETRMAQEMWDRTAQRNRDLTYNKVARADLDSLGGAGMLETFLDTMGADGAQYAIVRQLPPTAEEFEAAEIDAAEAEAKFGGGLPATLELIRDTDVNTWHAYLAAHFIMDHASVLPSEIDQRNFEFFGKTLSGQPEQRARWKRGIDAVEGQIGELLGKIYAERYFPPENQQAMDDLVENLRTAMAANLQDLSWMGVDTRVEAEAKLAAFTPKIGQPDTYKDYEGLAISPTSPLSNMLEAERWEMDYRISRLGGPVDRSEWFMFPQTVNAYYNPTFNEIVFPAAILQPPFFNLSADPAVNYGAIGAVIGHEMGHGFDDQGAKSDGEGNLRNWWTEQDKANFEKLQDRLGAQYDQYCPFDDGETCVNGSLTMGENIGDLGGLSLAYRAYKLSLDGQEAPVIDGYTGDQRFFMAWAQVWRSKVREEKAREYLVTDPHSPPPYRINGIVRNFDEWYEAFGVKPEDELYLPPEERVRIW